MMLVVALDKQRKIGIIPAARDPANIWHVMTRMLSKEPWYLQITCEEIKELFTVSVTVEALPAHKYPFPTQFLVKRKA